MNIHLLSFVYSLAVFLGMQIW